MSKPTKNKSKLSECECGCGDNTKGGRYLPGHDARHKRDLLNAALSGSKRAVTKLEKLGWTKFLLAKQARSTAQPSGLPGEEVPAGRKRRKAADATDAQGPQTTPTSEAKGRRNGRGRSRAEPTAADNPTEPEAPEAPAPGEGAGDQGGGAE